MRNYSRQREAILQVLSSTKSHPTADWIYRETRKLLPNISLGTVYRNLSALSKEGRILVLDFGDGKEHYDFDISPHIHLRCKKCGKIVDAGLNVNPLDSIKDDFGFKLHTPIYIAYGECKDCSTRKGLA